MRNNLKEKFKFAVFGAGMAFAAAACLLVHASAFKEIGGMDEGYFLYVEDTDLCRRFANAGREINHIAG